MVKLKNFTDHNGSIITVLALYEKKFNIELLCSSWIDGATNVNHIAAGFDQETAAAVMARLSVQRSENDDGPDVLRWLDRMLIRLVRVILNTR